VTYFGVSRRDNYGSPGLRAGPSLVRPAIAVRAATAARSGGAVPLSGGGDRSRRPAPGGHLPPRRASVFAATSSAICAAALGHHRRKMAGADTPHAAPTQFSSTSYCYDIGRLLMALGLAGRRLKSICGRAPRKMRARARRGRRD